MKIRLPPRFTTNLKTPNRRRAPLTEALLRTAGLAGLRDGFRLIREMTEGFWDGLSPAEDGDGVEIKVAPLTGLNGEGGADGTLIQPLRKIEIAPEIGEQPGLPICSEKRS